MSIEQNIADRRAAESLHRTIGELVLAEIPRLPSPESRLMFWRLLKESAEKNLPAVTLPTPPAKTERERRDELKATVPSDVAEALEMADEIENLASDLPAEGEDFGMSVLEKSGDIARNIAAHNRVTDAQREALSNMLDGLRRWFHD